MFADYLDDFNWNARKLNRIENSLRHFPKANSVGLTSWRNFLFKLSDLNYEKNKKTNYSFS